MKTEKAIVLKPFYDVLTEKDYKPGDVMADLLPLRRDYLVNVGLVKAIDNGSVDLAKQEGLIPEAVIKAAVKKPGPRVKK
jgi:hypothetical protein